MVLYDKISKTISLTRDELNAELRIAEFKNLQSELGSEFAEYFSKLDLKIIIKNEKVTYSLVFVKSYVFQKDIKTVLKFTNRERLVTKMEICVGGVDNFISF